MKFLKKFVSLTIIFSLFLNDLAFAGSHWCRFCENEVDESIRLFHHHPLGPDRRNVNGHVGTLDFLTTLCYLRPHQVSGKSLLAPNAFLPNHTPDKLDPLIKKRIQPLTKELWTSLFSPRAQKVSPPLSYNRFKRFMDPFFYLIRQEIRTAINSAWKNSARSTSISREGIINRLEQKLYRHLHISLRREKHWGEKDFLEGLSPWVPYFLEVSLQAAGKSGQILSPKYPHQLALNHEGHLSFKSYINGLYYPIFRGERQGSQAYFGKNFKPEDEDSLLKGAFNQYFLRLWDEKFVHHYGSSLSLLYASSLDPISYVVTQSHPQKEISQGFLRSILDHHLRRIPFELSSSHKEDLLDLAPLLHEAFVNLDRPKPLVHQVATSVFKRPNALLSTFDELDLSLDDLIDWDDRVGTPIHPNTPYFLFSYNQAGHLAIYDSRRGISYPLFEKDRTLTNAFLPDGYPASYPQKDVNFGTAFLNKFEDHAVELNKVLLGGVGNRVKGRIHEVLSETEKPVHREKGRTEALLATFGHALLTLDVKGIMAISVQWAGHDSPLSDLLHDVSHWLQRAKTPLGQNPLDLFGIPSAQETVFLGNVPSSERSAVLNRLNEIPTDLLFLDFGNKGDSWTLTHPLLYTGNLHLKGTPKNLYLLAEGDVSGTLTLDLPQTQIFIGNRGSGHITLQAHPILVDVKALHLKNGTVFSEGDTVLKSANVLHLGRPLETRLALPQTRKEILNWLGIKQRQSRLLEGGHPDFGWGPESLIPIFKRKTNNIDESLLPVLKNRNGSSLICHGNLFLESTHHEIFLDHLIVKIQGTLLTQSATALKSFGSNVNISNQFNLRTPAFNIKTNTLHFVRGWDARRRAPYGTSYFPPLTRSVFHVGGDVEIETLTTSLNGAQFHGGGNIRLLGDLALEATLRVTFAKTPHRKDRPRFPKETESLFDARGELIHEGSVSLKGSFLEESGLSSTALKKWSPTTRNFLAQRSASSFQNFTQLIDFIELGGSVIEGDGPYWILPRFLPQILLPDFAPPVRINGDNIDLPVPHPLLELSLLEEALSKTLQRGYISKDFPSGLEGLQRLRDNARRIEQAYRAHGQQITAKGERSLQKLSDLELRDVLNQPALFYEVAQKGDQNVLTPFLFLPDHLNDPRLFSSAVLQSGENLTLSGKVLAMDGGVLNAGQTLNAQMDSVNLTGARVKSGDETVLFSNGQMHLLPKQENFRFHNGDDRRGTLRWHFPTEIDAESINLQAGGHLVLEAAKLNAEEEVLLFSGGSLLLPSVQNVLHEVREYTESGNWFTGDTTITEIRHAELPQRTHIKAGRGIGMFSLTGDIFLQGSLLDTPETALRLQAPRGKLRIKTVKESAFFQRKGESSSIFWTSSFDEGFKRLKIINTTFNADPEQILLEAGQGIEVERSQKLLEQDAPLHNSLRRHANITQSWLKDQSQDWHHSHQSIGGPLATVLALGITWLTFGAGTALGTSIAETLGLESGGALFMEGAMQGLLPTLTTQVVTGTLSHEGNLFAALKDMTSGNALRSTALSFVTGGTLRSLGITLDPEQGFDHHLQHHVEKAFISAGIEGILSRDDLEYILKNQAKNIGINTVGSFGASRIGQTYAEIPEKTPLDYFTHKLLHGALGGAMGAALHRDTKKGILSGAFGAMASEIAAEMMFDMEDIAGQILARSENDFLTQEEFLLAYRDEVTQRANLAQLLSGSLGALMDLDVETLSRTGENAVENNFLFTALAALTAASAAWTAYDVYTTYLIEGPEAALKKLAIEGAVTLTLGLAGKVVYKVGKVTFANANAAFNAHLTQNSLMATVAKSCTKHFKSIQNKLFGKTKPTVRTSDGKNINLSGVSCSGKWRRKEINIENKKVYQNNSLIDPNRRTKTGQTNLERMKSGKPPVGPDGQSINLHHMGQRNDGTLIELTQKIHQKYSRQLHINSGTKTRSGIDRRKFNSWKEKYWQQRAKDFEKLRN